MKTHAWFEEAGIVLKLNVKYLIYIQDCADLRKRGFHLACMGIIAASVLLKLYINVNERRHTTEAPLYMSGTLFSNVNI